MNKCEFSAQFVVGRHGYMKYGVLSPSQLMPGPLHPQRPPQQSQGRLNFPLFGDKNLDEPWDEELVAQAACVGVRGSDGDACLPL